MLSVPFFLKKIQKSHGSISRDMSTNFYFPMAGLELSDATKLVYDHFIISRDY